MLLLTEPRLQVDKCSTFLHRPFWHSRETGSYWALLIYRNLPQQNTPTPHTDSSTYKPVHRQPAVQLIEYRFHLMSSGDIWLQNRQQSFIHQISLCRHPHHMPKTLLQQCLVTSWSDSYLFIYCYLQHYLTDGKFMTRWPTVPTDSQQWCQTSS